MNKELKQLQEKCDENDAKLIEAHSHNLKRVDQDQNQQIKVIEMNSENSLIKKAIEQKVQTLIEAKKGAK